MNQNHSRNLSNTNFEGSIDLNVITNDSFQCVKTKLLLKEYRTTVCAHNIRKDTDVSGLIVRNGIWEENLVTRIVRILSMNRQLSFIDIGANIGIYTMYAAKLGCKNVIAIECFRPNVERIRRAVQLENVQNQVVIMARALYNKSNVYLSLRTNIANNIGSQRLNAEVQNNENNSLVVQTIRFDDLLPVVRKRDIREAIIKIDIETSEHHLCGTGEQMFSQINIPFVMMEWANIKEIPSRANLVQEFFIKRGYIPFKSVTCEPETEKDYRLWHSQDIFWIKKTHTHLCKG
ncbi:unnamed protein product [Rotaria socialis]|uniref:Methyltransferase FkbM domain-containing protein n=4 Tax=Rotaria socialis TaxID=392032 RepID=A0A818BRW4_9BILA|nr:unnamed protein product [Rotaria socialis]CAF4892021.1 unnamed protein product [Rotaria socialis]